MAAPVVAGIAGLVKSQFPSYTWEQVTEQIMNTGDDIYGISGFFSKEITSGYL